MNNEMEIYIREKLRAWKWFVGTGIIVVTFLSNALASKLLYENDIASTKEEVKELRKVVETLSYNVIILCQKNGIEPKENPLGKFHVPNR